MRAVAVLGLLCAVTFVAGLGRLAIQDSDEAFYAEAGREMVASGDWTTPQYNFQPRLQKPILFYWLVAGTYRAFGVTETAARIWSALAGASLAFVAFAAGRRWLGPGPGLLAGVVVATSFGLVPIARQALPDVPLTCFVTLAIWAGFEAFGAPLPAPAGQPPATTRDPVKWLYLLAIALALGMLTKGPVAVVLPLTALVPLLWWERRAPRSWALSRGHLALAAGLFMLIAAPWYVAVTRAQGAAYLHQFFVGENVDRFVTSGANEWRGWFYVPILAGGLLPWSGFGALWIQPALARLRGRTPWMPVERRLVAWTLGPLIFFMVSIGSQPRYILPCLVPLAILLARTMWTRAAAAPGSDRPFTIAVVLGGAPVVLIGWLALRAQPMFAAATPGWSSTPAILLVAFGLVMMAAGFLRRRSAVPWIMAGCAAGALVVFERSVQAAGRPEPVEVLADAIRAHAPVPAACACGAFARSLNFYTHLPTVVAATDEEVVQFLARPQPVLAAIDSRTLERIERATGRSYPRLADVSYLDAGVRQRPGTLFRPDLEHVQRVVLIRSQ